MTPQPQTKEHPGRSGQTQQFGNVPSTQIRQQIRSRLFASSDETFTAEQLIEASQAGIETLLQSKGFSDKANISFDDELQDEQEAFIESIDVPQGAVVALPVPSTRSYSLPQMMALFGTNPTGQKPTETTLSVIDRNQIPGRNENVFRHAFGVSLGEPIRKSTSSLQNLIVSLEQEGKYVLTAPETVMLFGALIASGQGPKVGETWTAFAGGSMTTGSTHDVPSISLTHVSEGQYQIWSNIGSTLGSVIPTPPSVPTTGPVTYYVGTCCGRTFGHGSSR